MSDLLSSVRLVKMHAWEDVHRDRVERARNAEVALMFRINLLDGLIDSLYSANSSLGRIALVSQLPCVHNMTVRDNILYGEQMEEDRYLCVLRACQLLDDLSSFTAGDFTEIGEKGETLSGGQMQRIALARAAYSPRDIYLLDDPLSAVDSKVADRVFHDVLGPEGLLRDKSSLKLTWAVLKLSGLWVPASLLAFAGSGVAFTWQLLWMKEWRNAQSAASTVDGSQNVEILVLGEGRVLEFGPIAELLSRPSSHFRRMAYEAGVLPSAYHLEESCTTHL
ncbi:multidrug resistance protein, putative [Ixodes scapularis]|uniref:Multidrug resistance protein, putative n=1 Tax=Ixodes scapularis TaxID=6945 RepID=B7QKN2_IXOSC|nr:multidrug resistance protein, putative [Ixodes scapularis]|eukprot:XP_002415737.1 multidrug resistance protein, putative [Ixodes scapularis]